MKNNTQGKTIDEATKEAYEEHLRLVTVYEVLIKREVAIG